MPKLETCALPFAAIPSAKASFKVGTMYAIDGSDSFIYYGQVTGEKRIGFFRFRNRAVDVSAALSNPVMSCFSVGHHSIGQALRAGRWVKLGAYPLHEQLQDDLAVVQWPVGTLDVSVWKDGVVIENTQVHDPKIQGLEIMAVYDAIFHVPDRLQLDYTGGPNDWTVGGSIRRERRKKEELARMLDAPWHRLPDDWVPVVGS
jgi:hypothetical protein